MAQRVTLGNQASQSQKNLSNQRIEEAGKHYERFGVASQHEKHDQIMLNKNSVQKWGGRASFSNVRQCGSAASNQVNVKSAEADKMIEQSVADTARSVYSDKDKQIDKSQGSCETNARTFTVKFVKVALRTMQKYGERLRMDITSPYRSRQHFSFSPRRINRTTTRPLFGGLLI
ncbi:hypothetical protein AB6F62_11160 [Providencia huaxiensis]|uniref:hypothetical protein n=1 Tax=Providencia huaxiensis TaxID=2027290 RepID=UPI0034DD1757